MSQTNIKSSTFLNILKLTKENLVAKIVSLTLPYICTPSIIFGKRISSLFDDRPGTDIKIAYQTFKIISYFNFKFSLPARFCFNVVCQYTCSYDKNTSYIIITTRQVFVRIENYLLTIKVHQSSDPIVINAKPAEKQCHQNKILHYLQSAVLTVKSY